MDNNREEVRNGSGAAKRNYEIKIHLEAVILEDNGALQLLGK